MKKLIAVLGLLLVAATASAISQGPGGRLYMTQRMEDEFGDLYIELKSYELDANWDIVGADAPMDHGDILDNSDGYRNKQEQGISPEVETSGGNGFGELVLGAHYNQDPASAYVGYETMDILRVTPSAGSHSVLVLGTGRAGVGGWHNAASPVNSTERGLFAMPDRSGVFVGAGEYFTHHSDYFSYYQVVTDTNSDGDLTDNDEDYLTTSNTYGTPTFQQDWEFLGNRAYFASSYTQNFAPDIDGDPGTFRVSDAIGYYERLGDGSIADPKPFLWTRPSQTQFGLNGLNPITVAMAAAVVDGHDSVWFVNHSQSWVSGVQSESNDLMFATDLNDDGDAMDAGEQSIIFSNGSASNGGWDNPDDGGWTDMEVVEHDGTMFLIIQDTSAGWHIGRSLMVVELLPNGHYVGGDDGIHLIAATDLGGAGGDWEVLTEIEFDANAASDIPGDANGDGKIDGADLALWQQNYDPLGSEPTNDFGTGDWNEDGKIDGADLALWQQNYDPLGAGVAPVP